MINLQEHQSRLSSRVFAISSFLQSVKKLKGVTWPVLLFEFTYLTMTEWTHVRLLSQIVQCWYD